MRAVILAAGRGERLGELTQRIPKPMIEFRGRPILQQNIELCRAAGVHDIVINLHHLPDVITSRFGDGADLGVRITWSPEETLLGTSGAVRRIADRFWGGGADRDDGHFFVLYGDNFSDCALSELHDKALATGAMGVIGFHHRDDVSHSGVAEFDADGRITRFIEKPRPGETASHWVNAGVYCLRYDMLAHLPDGVSDFARDIFPALLAQGRLLHGVCYDADVRAFDTPEMLQRSITSE